MFFLLEKKIYNKSNKTIEFEKMPKINLIEKKTVFI